MEAAKQMVAGTPYGKNTAMLCFFMQAESVEETWWLRRLCTSRTSALKERGCDGGVSGRTDSAVICGVYYLRQQERAKERSHSCFTHAASS